MAQMEHFQEAPAVGPYVYTEGVVSTSDAPWGFFFLWLIPSVIIILILLFAYVLNSGVIDISRVAKRPLPLVGVPGDTIRLTLFKGDSDGGAWSTHDGFHLRLSNEETEDFKIFNLLPPGQSNDGYDCDECTDSFYVEGSFVVPTVPGEGAGVLSGTLSGVIRFPNVDTKLRTNVNIQIPVNLTIIPPGEGLASGAKERSRAWRIFWTVLVVDVALLVPGTILLWLNSGRIKVHLIIVL